MSWHRFLEKGDSNYEEVIVTGAPLPVRINGYADKQNHVFGQPFNNRYSLSMLVIQLH